jgi:hypothetical protein
MPATADKQQLVDAFERLSERSCYRRFLSNGTAGASAGAWPRRLAAALADRARGEGITSFTALMLADNVLMLNLLHDLRRVRVVHSELGVVELTVDLPETGARWACFDDGVTA